MLEGMRREKKEQLSKTAASGMVALVFLVLGFQIAVFTVKVIERPAAPPLAETLPEADSTDRRRPAGAEAAPPEVRRSKYGGYERPEDPGRPALRPAQRPQREYASFPFDPNTVTLAELQRLGLSARQAQTIENYRSKGGHFRSKADFQKMYVVSDTLFARLEPYIDIPKLELNAADSAALVTLRGIGPWYARKILDYRDRLGGYRDKAQLLEIEGMDAQRYAGFADGITVDTARIRPLDLWHASDTLLAAHPYLGPKGARSIVRYRALYDSARWNLADLVREGALSAKDIEKLKSYIEIR